jgi:hypothetical protein
LVAALLACLRELGLAVGEPTTAPPDGPVALVLVVLPPGELPAGAGHPLEEVLEPWRDRIVPVADGDHASSAFGDLSQLVLGDLGIDEAARRIRLIHDVGGATLAALVRLESSARAWLAEGEGRPGLLRGAAIDEAQGVVGRSSTIASDDVRRFVRASAHARTRLQRIQAVVAVVVAALLVAGSVAALAQRQAAVEAEHVAVTRTAAAEANRLAGLAVGMIGTDPDLPWILVRDALRSSATPEAIAAARRVAQVVPRHTSIRLTGIPSSLSTDPRSGRVVIGYVDGSVEVRSGADGTLQYSWSPPSEGAQTIAIAPGGDLVSVGSTVRDVTSGDAVASLDGHFAGWVDATRVLVAKDALLSVVDVRTSSTQPTQVTLQAGDTPAWSAAGDAPVVALLDGTRILSVDAATGTAIASENLSDFTPLDLATSADGSSVYVLGSGGAAGLVRKDGALAPVPANGNGLKVVAAGGTWLVGFGSQPVARIDQRTRTIVSTYLAHRGMVTGLGALPEGRTVTAGADRYLRLWEPLPDVNYGKHDGPLTLDAFTRGAPQFRALTRPQLALSHDGSVLVATDPNRGFVRTIDPATLETRSSVWVTTTPTSSLPADHGRAVVLSRGRGLDVIDIGGPKTLWSQPWLSVRVGAALAAIDETGTNAVVAGPQGIDLTSSDGNVNTLTMPYHQTPAWVGFDGSVPVMITTTGEDFRGPAFEGTALPDLGSPVAGAAISRGAILLVGADGTLAEVSDGRLRVIRRLGSEMIPFALHPSADGSAVAVLGAKGAYVVATSSGELIADLSTPDADSTVRDAVVDGSSAWIIRADGGVWKERLRTPTQLVEEIDSGVPRAATPAEEAAFASVVVTIGAD